MKKLTIVISLILALMIVNPVLASKAVPTGDRITVYSSGEYPADTAFHISHGWQVEPEELRGGFDFKLEVDGKFVEETFVDRYTTTFDDNTVFISLVWVFNFPDGMKGEHTFAGHWFMPCQSALDAGLVTECQKPNASVEVMSSAATIAFITTP